MRILVCVKRVPAPGAKINLTDDARSIDTAHLAFTTSPHEECAVEAAVELTEHHGGIATVLTVGPPESEEQLRYAASVGMHAAALVDGAGELDPQATAAAIVEAVTVMEAADGAFDLLLFGNESADGGNFQVGIRVAHALDRPMVNGAKHLSVEDWVAIVERESDAGREQYRLPLPAAVGIKEGLNLPRYPTMRGRLASKKIEVAHLSTAAEAGGLVMHRLERPVEEQTDTVVLGHGAEAAPAVVDELEGLGVL